MIRRVVAVAALMALAGGLAADERPAKKAAAFGVKVVGKGRPVLLIPGLASSGDVWDGVVAKLKDKHECHVFTLAGFAGQPAMKGPFLDAVRKEIAAYVRDKKLKKPAVIGHSLGGLMVFALGAAEPELFGPLIAVDGVPCIPALINPKRTKDDLKKGEQIGQAMAKAKRADFDKMLRGMLGTWIDDEKVRDKVVGWGEKSDQATVARAMGELWTRDLRKDAAAKIKSPVLLIAAAPRDGFGATADEVKERFEAQVKGVKGAKVVFAKKAKHFIMYDEPKWMFEQMETVLGKK